MSVVRLIKDAERHLARVQAALSEPSLASCAREYLATECLALRRRLRVARTRLAALYEPDDRVPADYGSALVLCDCGQRFELRDARALTEFVSCPRCKATATGRIQNARRAPELAALPEASPVVAAPRSRVGGGR
jgi:hypothetical protein